LLEMPMSLYPVCSPQLLERFGIDGSDRSLAREHMGQPPFDHIPLLCEDRRLDLWGEWSGDNSLTLSNQRRVIADSNVRTQAAIDGQGFTMADALMSTELENGSLVAPFEYQLEGYGYALMVSPGRYMNRKVRDLQDWLLTSL